METLTAAKSESTLYPKIRKLSDLIHRIKQKTPDRTKIPIIGSIKLHGAHVDLVFFADAFRIQSRNVLELTPSNDLHGVEAFMSPIHESIVQLRMKILQRYNQLNPNNVIDLDLPIIIAGEWCGMGIQKKMAISKLPRFFVIISIRVNGSWVPEQDYADISDEQNRIYNIGKVGFYELVVNMENIDTSEAEIQNLVTKVERQCPFGQALGAEGRGEGIVWKAVGHFEDPEMWFKYKGDSQAVSHSWKLDATAATSDNRVREESFAKTVVTEPRMQQGWDYLRETGVRREKAAMGAFLAWVTNNIFEEEKREMAEMGFSKAKLRPVIKAIARPWFEAELVAHIADAPSELEKAALNS